MSYLNQGIFSIFAAAIVGGSSNCVGCLGKRQFPELYVPGGAKPGSGGSVIGGTGSDVSGTGGTIIGGTSNSNYAAGGAQVGCTGCTTPSGALTAEGLIFELCSCNDFGKKKKPGFWGIRCINTAQIGGSGNVACGSGSTTIGSTSTSNNGFAPNFFQI